MKLRFLPAVLPGLLLLFVLGCASGEMSKTIYYQFSYYTDYKYKNDTLSYTIKNPLLCPLRVTVSSENGNLPAYAKFFDTVTLRERTDTIARLYLPGIKDLRLRFTSSLGDATRPVVKKPIGLPFPKQRKYRIIQGYNAAYSHNSDYSRFAIDFNLKIKDTVCSADDGFVVGVIKDYKHGGKTEEWKKTDKSNFITIYHPLTGLYTQYVHLVYQGAFVKVGDTVSKGQPIGLSGMTGYTDIEHLHFNVLIPKSGTSLVSTEIEFEQAGKGSELKKGMIVENK